MQNCIIKKKKIFSDRIHEKTIKKNISNNKIFSKIQSVKIRNYL
jgi:hypothetical protein